MPAFLSDRPTAADRTTFKNEHICASAIYYYDCHNISESRLAFRVKVEDDIPPYYEQDVHKAPEEHYGIQNETPAIQNIGDVLTRVRTRCVPPNYPRASEQVL